jgi:predicted DNA-binding transcriptional regulator AlpA
MTQSNIQEAPLAKKLLDVKDLEMVLNMSQKHIRRMADAGLMPRPVKVGRLTRWSVADIDRWIANGCPKCPQD